MWNIAADIVVNGMVRAQTEYALPSGAVEAPKLAHLSVEEIYEQFATGKGKLPKLTLLDLLEGEEAGASVDNADALNVHRTSVMQSHWSAALHQASAVAQRIDKGFGSKGLDRLRDYQCATEAQLSWRELLWQFMVSTPCDFGGFDRRFIHRKLYLEDVVGESIEVAICIDTSGSIVGPELAAFMGEIQGILDAYPHIRGRLFFADAELYGPHEFAANVALPEATGGGGTDFRPFFEWVEASGDEKLAIYFTDGYGQFPNNAPSVKTLWVVLSGGLETGTFPFGQVARMGTA
jgi:predicted metal-dependent peptidase